MKKVLSPQLIIYSVTVVVIGFHLTCSEARFKWLIKTTKPHCKNKVSLGVFHARAAANSLGSQTRMKPKMVKPVHGAPCASTGRLCRGSRSTRVFLCPLGATMPPPCLSDLRTLQEATSKVSLPTLALWTAFFITSPKPSPEFVLAWARAN